MVKNKNKVKSETNQLLNFSVSSGIRNNLVSAQLFNIFAKVDKDELSILLVCCLRIIVHLVAHLIKDIVHVSLRTSIGNLELERAQVEHEKQERNNSAR